MAITFNYDSFPDPAHLPAPVRKLANERAKFATEAHDIGTELADLITGDHELTAAKADDKAQADAARAGKPDPGRTHTATHRATLTDAYRRQQAHSKALAGITTDLVAAILKHTPQLLKDAEKVEAQAAADYLAAIDALKAAHDTYASALGVAGWADRITEAVREPGTGGTTVVFSPEGIDPLTVGMTTLDTDRAIEALRATANTHTRRRARQADLAQEAAKSAARRAAQGHTPDHGQHPDDDRTHAADEALAYTLADTPA